MLVYTMVEERMGLVSCSIDAEVMRCRIARVNVPYSVVEFP